MEKKLGPESFIIYLFFLLQAMKHLQIVNDNDISWELIRLAISSVARTAVIPMQDILRLGSSARMNTPATQVSTYNYILFRCCITSS